MAAPAPTSDHVSLSSAPTTQPSIQDALAALGIGQLDEDDDDDDPVDIAVSRLWCKPEYAQFFQC